MFVRSASGTSVMKLAIGVVLLIVSLACRWLAKECYRYGNERAVKVRRRTYSADDSTELQGWGNLSDGYSRYSREGSDWPHGTA